MACSGSSGLPVFFSFFFFHSLEAKDSSHGWSRSCRPFHIELKPYLMSYITANQTHFPSLAIAFIKQLSDAFTESDLICTVSPHYVDMKT